MHRLCFAEKRRVNFDSEEEEEVELVVTKLVEAIDMGAFSSMGGD